jgi:hypothetical protein
MASLSKKGDLTMNSITNDETRKIVQDYIYDAMDELHGASVEEYIQWFKDNLTAYPEDIDQAVAYAYDKIIQK